MPQNRSASGLAAFVILKQKLLPCQGTSEEAKASNVAVSGKLKLLEEPRSDCSVYNQLLAGQV